MSDGRAGNPNWRLLLPDNFGRWALVTWCFKNNKESGKPIGPQVQCPESKTGKSPEGKIGPSTPTVDIDVPDKPAKSHLPSNSLAYQGHFREEDRYGGGRCFPIPKPEEQQAVFFRWSLSEPCTEKVVRIHLGRSRTKCCKISVFWAVWLSPWQKLPVASRGWGRMQFLPWEASKYIHTHPPPCTTPYGQNGGRGGAHNFSLGERHHFESTAWNPLGQNQRTRLLPLFTRSLHSTFENHQMI